MNQRTNDKRVSEAVIHRLPKYYRQLKELQKRGVERISSSELSKEMGLNASQIRQDFNCFGGFGQQGYGYQVSYLLQEISKIIGLSKKYDMVIIGVGNIGHALMSYTGFDQEGYRIIGAFDVNPDLVGKSIAGTTINHMDTLKQFLQQKSVDIGIICTQKEDAQNICDVLVESGVCAIWNFTPIDVLSDKASIENIHLTDHLYVLSYRLANADH